MKTDRERNTFQYRDVDIIVEADIESVSGISFLIKDHTIPGNAFFAFHTLMMQNDLLHVIVTGIHM